MASIDPDLIGDRYLSADRHGGLRLILGISGPPREDSVEGIGEG